MGNGSSTIMNKTRCMPGIYMASQIAQAEALKFLIERVRIMKWYTGGIIWWNVIDGWPQFSDAIVYGGWLKKIAMLQDCFITDEIGK